MGRLTKAKIDKIRRLRDEGYTQKEVSEKADVDIKTVRKYDSQKLTPKVDTETDEIRFSNILKRIEWLEDAIREIGFGKMIVCPFNKAYNLDSEDEENSVDICKKVSWDKRPKELQVGHVYHGPQDDKDHYLKEPHIIQVEGKWYRIPTLEDCIPCTSFYHRKS